MLRAIDLDVEERVEEIEAGDPERHRGTEHPRFPGQMVRNRDPRADRCESVDSAEPEVAEPGPALEVGVDDEARDGDRPQQVRQRCELPDRYEEERERRSTERGHLRDRQL